MNENEAIYQNKLIYLKEYQKKILPLQR